MEEENINQANPAAEEIGEIKIAEDVVLVVAGLAVGEVKGVTVVNSLTDGIVEKFTKKNYGKGIRVEMQEKNVTVDVHVVVDYGVKIPDAAWELQETVKKNIESMTNLSVSGVNIFVDGINIEKEPKPEPKPKEKLVKEEKKPESKEEKKEENKQ